MIVESKEAIKVEKTTLDKKFHLISYGCQMNFADSEVVASILESIAQELRMKADEKYKKEISG